MSEFIAEYMYEGCAYAVLGVFTGNRPAQKALDRLKIFATKKIVQTRIVEQVSKRDWDNEVESE